MKNRLTGILVGTAVGDALGLPAEGLSPSRRQRLMPGPWRHLTLTANEYRVMEWTWLQQIRFAALAITGRNV